MSRHPVALITGGQGDLARAIAARLQAAEWRVLAPGRAEMDVACRESVRRFFRDHVEELDLLVNNAGTTRDGLLAKMGEEDWDTVVDTNLKGAFFCCQCALRLMLKQRNGHIVNVGSFSAIQPQIGQANYAAAKAGLMALTRSLAKETGRRNVRVNCVLPGFLRTKMTQGLAAETIERARESHVLGRFNTCEDVARFVEFLHSMENVSGQTFQLDSR